MENVKHFTERDVVVLEVSYGLEMALQEAAGESLTRELLDAYEITRQDGQIENPSCLVVLVATTAGSPLLRALFELYQRVQSERGELICVDFPTDYLASLTSLGLTELRGFRLSHSRDEALDALNFSS